MNLHIVPDNTFINKFYENLQELGLSDNNRIVVRINDLELKAIKQSLPFAPLYSSRFESLIGNTFEYEKVFIHYFTPLLYRWVATHKFRELSWMVWGGDLYNLPRLDSLCYEPLTFSKYVKRNRSFQRRLYNVKVLLTQTAFRKNAYSKVRNVLTWMSEEYKFAIKHLPIDANHKFFFYENQLPYHQLDPLLQAVHKHDNKSIVVGNSGSPTNNHLDAVQFLEDNRVRANLVLPVSYGDSHYISFLKKEIKFSYGDVEFLDRYMPFEEYVKWLASTDGLIMNTFRPQGYGNILMMMYLGKPVYFNARNISLPDINAAGLAWKPMEGLTEMNSLDHYASNRETVLAFLSHDRLLVAYRELFS